MSREMCETAVPNTSMNLFVVTVTILGVLIGIVLLAVLYFSDGPVWGVDNSVVKPRDSDDD